MRDLVIVPVFSRAAYLFLCLEHLLAADGGAGKEVWIVQDRRPGMSGAQAEAAGQIPGIAATFAGKFAALRLIQREPHTSLGNPRNFLEAYREAHATDARFVYLVEDDVLVAPDFFRWHEAVQARGDYFCSVGWHCIRNPQAVKSGDPAAYVESGQDYSSIGVCWRREKLAPIVAHAREEYYRDPCGYFRAIDAPGEFIRRGWVEQAALVLLVLLRTPGAKVAWPTLPRCAHIGVCGYHRPQGERFVGALNAKVDELRKMLSDQAALNRCARDGRADIETLCPVPEWNPERLRVVQRIGKA